MLRGARGATTVETNERQEIIAAVGELLSALIQENDIQIQDIGAAIFSSTPDIDAAFPAAGARQLGWTEVPLFGTQEIDCPTGVPQCIRVLILWNTELSQQSIKHIYLKNASVLRPDIPLPKHQ
ncbi:chorismate mutase [Anaerosporomusa subterranea]|uniref:chorismate mutase n=1 Tax=Anaerosporomusa subterranea TaxID=1794912 RepID=A0A154BQ55_ANASB|nr:chorismate mutase [Anaerosporomusa subterranea]KYZ76124.1 chorismate mutase [Anaerosporomusa subterranea]